MNAFRRKKTADCAQGDSASIWFSETLISSLSPARRIEPLKWHFYVLIKVKWNVSTKLIRKESSYLFILAAVDMCLCVSLCARHFRSSKNQGHLENSIFNHYLTWLLMQLRRQLALLWWHQPPGTSISVDYPENCLCSSVLKD